MRSGPARHDGDHRQYQRHKRRECDEQEDLTPCQVVRVEPRDTVGAGHPDHQNEKCRNCEPAAIGHAERLAGWLQDLQGRKVNLR